MAAKKKKGGGMSPLRKKFKQVASAVGSGGAIAIPSFVMGFHIKGQIDRGINPEYAIMQSTTGYYPPTADWKIERLLPLFAGIGGGYVWKKAWSWLGKAI
jgi:hypothetical protein